MVVLRFVECCSYYPVYGVATTQHLPQVVAAGWHVVVQGFAIDTVARNSWPAHDFGDALPERL